MCALVAMPIVVPLALAAEYWSSMYGARGYLTMSLPVRGRTLFAAKVAWAVTAMLVTGLAFTIGLLSWMALQAHLEGPGLSAAVDQLRGVVTALGTGMTALLVVSVLLSVVTVVEVAAVLSIGAEGRWNHLGMGAPVIGLVLLYLANEVVSLAATLLIPVSVRLGAGPGAGGIEWRWMLPELLETVRTGGGQTTLVGLGMLLVGPLTASLLAWWAVTSIERRTSLR